MSETDTLPVPSTVPITKNLAKALLKAQSKFPAVEKRAVAQAGQRQYGYADLATTLEMVDPALHEAGLVLYHQFDAYGISTTLAHAESGESITSMMPIDWEMGPQQIGSQVTYFRRYAVHAMLGLRTGDDDDGASAQGSPAQPRPAAKPKPKPPADQKPGALSQPQVKRMFAIANESADRMDIKKEAVTDWIKQWITDLGIEHTKDLSRAQYDKICEQLEKLTLTDLAVKPTDGEMPF